MCSSFFEFASEYCTREVADLQLFKEAMLINIKHALNIQWLLNFTNTVCFLCKCNYHDHVVRNFSIVDIWALLTNVLQAQQTGGSNSTV